MKNKVKPRYYNNVRNSISSPKTYRHGKESLSQVKTQKTSRIHKKYNLTSNSNKLQTNTSNTIKNSNLEEAKSYEEPSSFRIKRKQTPKFLKLQKQSSQILDSKLSQGSYIGKSQTTRRESNISAFPPKLCEDFLLSNDKINSTNQVSSHTHLTPVLTQKKTNVKTFGVSSSSSLSMFNKMDLKIQSVNFNGSSQDDRQKNGSGKFSYCEMKSSPTIKEIQLHGSNSHIQEYHNKEYGADFKLKRSPTKDIQDKKKPKNVKIFREYGSEIIGVGKKNEIKKAIGLKMMKTQEKAKSKVPRNPKGSEELVSISSMFNNTQRKDKRKRKNQHLKQVNK
jgi:hypothetical protein